MKVAIFILLFISVICDGILSKFKELDSPVNSITWCGASVVFTKDDEAIEQTHENSKKIVFLLTDNGKVWKSQDYGSKWTEESYELERISPTAIDLFIESMQISPADSRVIYLFSSKIVSFRSRDCGKNWEAFSHAEGLYDFKLNKMDDKWIMAFKDKPCAKKDENCRETYKKEIYATRDGGSTWNIVLSHVREASWDKLLQYQMVPDERIIACHIQNGVSVVSYSDDYFKTTVVMKENAQGYFQTNYYIFVLSKVDQNSDGFQLLISPAYLDKFVPTEIKLPIESLSQHSFTILDTTEGQIFISVSHLEENQKLTNIYVSDFRGWKFTLSLLHNVRSLDNGNCDFERILGMEGVYIANVYDHSEVDKLKGKEKGEQKSLEPYKKTYISYDKGGNWHSLRAPFNDANGKQIICSGDCSLHLKGRTEVDQNPIYSSENSPGVALGIGNTGLYLTQKDSELSTYLTRDGGHQWYEIRKGSHMYEIGDRGGIIVMAKDDEATNEIIYSWNEGLTWETLKVSDKPFFVQNIVTEPSNMEQKFIVYGQAGVGERTGVVVGLDFKTLHQRVCSGIWDPTMPESDYEFWIPKNFENGKCLFGRKVKYIRRKRDASCFNQEESDKKFYIETCPCIEDDWECDYGFYRRIEGGPCVPLADDFEEDDTPDILKPPKDCKGTFMQTQGYRKVSGDYCQGGVDLSPKQVPCPNDEQTPEENNKQNQQPQFQQQASQDIQLWTVIAILLIIVIALMFKERILSFINNMKGTPQQKQQNKGTALQSRSYEQLRLFQNEDDDV